MTIQPIKTFQIIVTGLVQGVGFRPFVYRIALKHRLNGWVQNTNENVRIRITGSHADIAGFLASLENEAPPAAMIEKIETEEMPAEAFATFSILKSSDVSEEITEISPDIAVCAECMADIRQPGNRLGYPFVNCTNCGPRFTIIRDLPYDRAKTTMSGFAMCPSCRNEYETITDRRFHAQPTACSHCGPGYELFAGEQKISVEIEEIIRRVAHQIEQGGIVLIKGLGGMHLACDAFNESAVEKLREVKQRDRKPFAVMFRNMKAVELHAAVDSNEAASLQSWRRPIVLLERKSRCCSPLLPGNISSGLNLVGVMLPYMPFHYQLFQQLKTDAIVLTSGNLSSEPILIDNQAAISRFSARMDMMVLHNRDIHNRTDDSVVRIIAGRERLFRRSRGYVPAPVHTTLNTDGILAFGAELTNCFAIGKGKKIFLSQHIGDLQGFETTLFYEQTIQRFLQLFRMKPTLLAVDMHPEYISTKTARNFGELPLVRVQHHHAHIAGCMAEHCLDEPVIGIAFDGTGYGDDGCIWGAEFFSCTLLDYKRLNHFEYLPLPGGDHAAEEPWRMAVSVLYKTFGKDFRNLDLPLFREVDPENIELLVHMIDRNINCPLTSGAGRLFDAVSSLLGLCQVASFQAEGPMKLESQVLQHCHDTYPYDTGQPIGFGSTIRGIVADIQAGTNVNIIASKFHNTIITVIFETALNIREKEHLNKVVLSGGVFQNKYLLEHAVTMLEQAGFEVYTHMRIPTNDGGIALGQLAVASKRRSMSCV